MLVIKKDDKEYRLWYGVSDGKLWIDLNNGEGGVFEVDKLFDLIDKFFKENF